MQFITTFCQHFFTIFIESAPWLLLGFFIAGIIKSFVPQNLLQKHLGEKNILAIIKGAFFGAPLPLCSCGVIPAALSLHQSGASKPATTSFLIATPETGVDSISITYALLGPLMAIVRPIAAISTAIVAGLAVLFFDKNTNTLNNKSEQVVNNNLTACCGKSTESTIKGSMVDTNFLNASTRVTTKIDEQRSTDTIKEKSCCANNETTQHSSTIQGSSFASVVSKLKSGFYYAFVTLLKDISVWLLIGLVLAAMIVTLIPASFLETWGTSPYAYVIMAVIGVPMYICATASTPIAASLLITGVSPGAILVFLLVGPATNIATLSLVRQEMGQRTLIIYVVSIILMSFFFGVITDWIAQFFALQHAFINTATHHLHTSMLALVSAMLLAVLLAHALWEKYGASLI